MAYNTNEILKDKHGNPISQYYNSAMDRYEPLEGVAGANKVTIEDNPLSLIPILETLERLTGTVIDEETRKGNEVDRESNENLRQSLYQDLLNELVRIEAIDKQVPQYIVDKIGNIDNLTTVEKDNLVNAINEINNKIDNIDVNEDIEAHNIDENAHEDIRNDVLSNVNNIGSLDNLITNTKNNTVGAINEVKQQSNDVDEQVKTKVNKTNSVVSTDFKSGYSRFNALNDSRLAYGDYLTINTRIKPSNNSIMVRLKTISITDNNSMDVILRFTIRGLTIQSFNALSNNTETPRIRLAFNENDELLIECKGNFSYTGTYVDLIASRHYDDTGRFSSHANPLSSNYDIKTVPYTSKGVGV